MNPNKNHNSLENNHFKNVAVGSFLETKVDDGFYVLTYQNENDGVETVEREIDSTYIQFHFCPRATT